MDPRRQGVIGVALATAVIASWLALHIHSVFFHPLEGAGFWLAAPLIALICWLNVGLFIIAHDAMHGSLAPLSPKIGRMLGTIALRLYAGFSYGRLLPKHMAHHRRPGTADDPDFHADHPRSFWPWYREFMSRYFGLREFLLLSVAVAAYLLIGARIANLLLFWALPAGLSSLQLFYFGTYQPHRHETIDFKDDHRARSSNYGRLVSLLTCFHFGYHHEHHLSPHVPWWRLPAERRRRSAAR